MIFQEPTTLDTYESLCDYARRYSESLDDLRWILGDCANTVMERDQWGKGIEHFARDIGQRKTTIYQYAKVADFYPMSLRRRLREDMPNINYSHMRDSLRWDDVEKAVAWLNEVSINDWTADEAARKLTERLGHQTHDSIDGIVDGFRKNNGAFIIEIAIGAKEFNQFQNVSRVTIKSK